MPTGRPPTPADRAVATIACRPAGELRERGGGAPAHILAAWCYPETGKSLDIAPSGWQKTRGARRAASQW